METFLFYLKWSTTFCADFTQKLFLLLFIEIEAEDQLQRLGFVIIIIIII